MMGYKGGKAMGLFLLGASPGGGTSNMFSKLLGGDMTMSVTMTTLSTLASMGKFHTNVGMLTCRQISFPEMKNS